MLFPIVPDPRASYRPLPPPAPPRNRRPAGLPRVLPHLVLHDDLFDHEHVSEEARAKMAAYIIAQETVELTTVGIDIGSSTSHLLFAKILLARESQQLSSRFVVIRREVMWRSPIMLTPFVGEGLIDAERLDRFVKESYAAAGLRPQDIDSGAVILTGEAIKRRNARAIDELFADEAGKFVCATAGHHLEARLAAHGSGAARLSYDRETCVLHVDIGGGTTKLALIDRGNILAVSAFAVGGRLIARDEHGAWTRVDESAKLAAADLGIAVDPESLAKHENRVAIARRLASVALDVISGGPLDDLGQSLLLTDPLERTVAPTAITFSGGVAEYLFGREETEYGDIAKDLAGMLRADISARLALPVIDPGVGIRATVIGASQFTVQVSGKTVYLSDPAILPLRGVPVLRIELPHAITEEGVAEALRRSLARSDRGPEGLLALAFDWTRNPDYHELIVLCRAIRTAFAAHTPREHPLVVLVDGDVGKTIGHLLVDELHLQGDVISIDGVQLQDFDFVDIGEMMTPPGVIPLVIKSLVFS